MVKAEVKTPNKRKSFGNDTPAKKQKLENGKNNEKTPKKQFQSPKNNQQLSPQNKKNKPNQGKTDSGSPKKVKPFAGPKQIDNKQKRPKSENSESPEKKKKRRNQYEKLIVDVKAKQGSKDPELLKSIDEKINAITSRPEMTKTAKKKLGILQKLKLICVEGSEVVAAKSKAKVEAQKAVSAKGKTDKKTASQQAAQGNKKKAAVKTAPVKSEEDEDSDEEEESDAEESGEEEENESGEEGDSDAEGKSEEEDDDDDEEDDDDDDDDSEEEAPAPKDKPPATQANPQKDTTQGDKSKLQSQSKKQVDLDELKNINLVTKGQTRFVLFVGNIPYDTTRQDLVSHFSKAGEIVHVRLPTDKGSNRPRGFGYIEVKDEITYQKCLSMHHTQIKGRQINVLYTQGGKKKGEDKKKEIKVKNMKLHGLRTQGKLAGSVKQSQKRSFRRKKSKEAQNKSEDSVDA